MTRSVEEFSQERYEADVLKVEVPVTMKYVAGSRMYKGPQVWTRAEAKAAFRRVACAARRPLIYLSGGVGYEEFAESLELAAEAEIPWSGMLCGRALWQDGVLRYAAGGLKALENWLSDAGAKNMQELNDRLKAATPWLTCLLSNARSGST